MNTSACVPCAMPGNNTALVGLHPSRIGELAEEPSLTKGATDALEPLLGRELSADETTRICDAVSTARNIRDNRLRGTAASRQSVKRTLAFIASASDDAALDALNNCDADTECEMVRAAYLHSGLTLQETAKKALIWLKENQSDGGRPGASHQPFLASQCLSLWQLLGRTDFAISGGPLSFSPIFKFASVLFDEVDRRAFDHRKLRSLLTAARKGFYP